jgi:hypothetical protein
MKSKQEPVITLDHAPRQSWASLFAASHPVEPETILGPALANKFDVEDWEW